MNAKAHVSDKKKETLKSLEDNIKNYKTVIISNIFNLPSVQFQEIRKKLRDKIKIVVIKRRVLLKTLEKLKLNIPEIEKLGEGVKESIAVLFSNEDPFILAGTLEDNSMPAKAKPGQIPEKDIEISAGPTDFPPGPMITELSDIGLKTKIEAGKIAIKESKVVAKAGEPINAKVASVLGKLDVRPFKIGLKADAIFNAQEKKVYFDIFIDKEGTLEKLKQAEASLLLFAIHINYPTKETIGFLLLNAESAASFIKEKYMKEEESQTESSKEEETKEPEKKEEIKEKSKSEAKEEKSEKTVNDKKEDQSINNKKSLNNNTQNNQENQNNTEE